MKLSPNFYQKATKALEYLEKNPGKSFREIGAAINHNPNSIQHVVREMVAHGVLRLTEGRTKGGKTHFYSATGKPLPERSDTSRNVTEKAPHKLAAGQHSPIDYSKLPTFLRAITPFAENKRTNGKVVQGHTIDQHKKQTQLARADRSKASRGVVYTGESRL